MNSWCSFFHSLRPVSAKSFYLVLKCAFNPLYQKRLGFKDRQGILSCRRLVSFYYTNKSYSYGLFMEVNPQEVKVIIWYIGKKSFGAHWQCLMLWQGILFPIYCSKWRLTLSVAHGSLHRGILARRPCLPHLLITELVHAECALHILCRHCSSNSPSSTSERWLLSFLQLQTLPLCGSC